MVTRGAALALIAALGTDAYGSAPDHARMQPVVRLVARRYQAPGDPSTASVPTATVGRELRPVLAAPPLVPLGTVNVPEPGRSRTFADLTIPEPLRGTTLRFVPFVGLPDVGPIEVKPAVVRRAHAVERVRISVNRRAPRPPVVHVLARQPPEERWVTDALEIPRDARLRFATGVDELQYPPALPTAVFTLAVLDGGSEDVVFHATTRAEDRAWVDAEIGLERYAGRTVRLRFEAKAEAPSPDLPIIVPVWGDPTIVVPAPPAPPPRSVLLVSIDTLRPDHLGCYGYARPTSPSIDALLAAEGTVFERAYSQFPHTAASHMTMLTGLYPCVHHVFGNFRPEERLRPEVHTLPELLRDVGYATAAFTEDGFVTALLAFGRGFGTFVEDRSPDITKPTGHAESTFRNALAWIRAHAEEPWFVFVHTYQVHEPYVPPPGYAEEVAWNVGDDAGAHLAALYDGEIRYTDDLLAELLAGVGDPLVILVSDHGEQFGEHGLFAHGNSLYDELLHVTFIMRAGGLVPAGRRVGAAVGLIDVTPTVLELLGLPRPASLQGRSLLPLLRGAAWPPRTLFASLPARRLVSARTADGEWIVDERSGAGEMFAAGHPDRSRNGAPVTAPWVLEQYQQVCAAKASGPTAAAPETVDPAVREKLRALGYVE